MVAITSEVLGITCGNRR